MKFTLSTCLVASLLGIVASDVLSSLEGTKGTATLSDGRGGSIEVTRVDSAAGFGVRLVGQVTDTQAGDTVAVYSGYDCANPGEELVSNGLSPWGATVAEVGAGATALGLTLFEVLGHVVVVLDQNNKVAGCGRIISEGELGTGFAFAIMSSESNDIGGYVIADNVAFQPGKINLIGNIAGSFTDEEVIVFVVDETCESVTQLSVGSAVSTSTLAVLHSSVDTAFFGVEREFAGGLNAFSSPHSAVVTDTSGKVLGCGAFNALALAADPCAGLSNARGVRDSQCIGIVQRCATSFVRDVCGKTCCQHENQKSMTGEGFSSSIALVGVLGLVVGAGLVTAFRRRKAASFATLDE